VSEIKYPSENADESIALITDKTNEDMTSKKDVNDDGRLKLPNYVLDLSNINNISEMQAVAIESIIADDGDTFIYIYKGGKLQSVGKVRGDVWSTAHIAIGEFIFPGCRIFKNFEVGKKAELIKIGSVKNLRLNI